MVECGAIDQPPSFQNLTIWGIITYICMLIIGINSIYGVIGALGFHNALIDILNLVGSGFGVAGLIFAILSIVQHNGAYMKISMTCFFICCIISLVVFVFYILKGGLTAGNILSCLLNLALSIFLCYLFYVQSKNFA